VLNQIWIEIDDFHLKFFTTFRSVLGPQAALRISQIHWGCLWCLSVAD